LGLNRTRCRSKIEAESAGKYEQQREGAADTIGAKEAEGTKRSRSSGTNRNNRAAGV
jgi:hypothetical protein